MHGSCQERFCPSRLAEQFSERSLDKVYVAIVCGEVPRVSGEIRAAIARHPTHRKRMAANEGEGREAHTSYKVLERLRASTFVEAHLHTGRTHQIRVHFQYISFPIAGDETYGSKQTKKLAELTGYNAAARDATRAKVELCAPAHEQEDGFRGAPSRGFSGGFAATQGQIGSTLPR